MLKIYPINNINFANQPVYKKNRYIAQSNLSSDRGMTILPSFNPAYLQINFCGIKNSSPDVIYDNYTNVMPVTLKNAFEKSSTENRTMADINYEAFHKLADCHSIYDIKASYPDEAIFKDLITPEEAFDYLPNRESKEFLDRYMSLFCAADKQEPVFKWEAHPYLNKQEMMSDNDLTTYLVKKAILEGRSQEEIENHFKKDLNPKVCEKAGIDIEKFELPRGIYKILNIRYSNVPSRSAGFRNSLVQAMDTDDHRYMDIDRAKFYNRVINKLTKNIFDPQETINQDSAEVLPGALSLNSLSKKVGMDSKELKEIIFCDYLIHNLSLLVEWRKYLVDNHVKKYCFPDFDNECTATFMKKTVHRNPKAKQEFMDHAMSVCEKLEKDFSVDRESFNSYFNEIQKCKKFLEDNESEAYVDIISDLGYEMRKRANWFAPKYYDKQKPLYSQYIGYLYAPQEEKNLKSLLSGMKFRTPYINAKILNTAEKMYNNGVSQEEIDKYLFSENNLVAEATHNFVNSQEFFNLFFSQSELSKFRKKRNFSGGKSGLYSNLNHIINLENTKCLDLISVLLECIENGTENNPFSEDTTINRKNYIVNIKNSMLHLNDTIEDVISPSANLRPVGNILKYPLKSKEHSRNLLSEPLNRSKIVDILEHTFRDFENLCRDIQEKNPEKNLLKEVYKKIDIEYEKLVNAKRHNKISPKRRR